MLSWEKLLNPVRRKDLHGSSETIGTASKRTEIERDYDRILFATPTRRLADKTQVFPMEENDSVRTRLTHSHEVSNLARGIGIQLAFEHAERVFGPDHEKLNVKRNIPPLLAAVGLAHDLGNPPFGHQGELAMQQWFAERNDENFDLDFLEFDGNAQTFRLLTRLQVLNDQFGLNLTLATLAALLKYPSIYGSENKGGFKKAGIFKSERSIVQEVWEHTGLSEGIRHPLAYIMEACDDIAYSVIDAEDTVKKGYASFYDLMDYLDSNSHQDEVIERVITSSKRKNEEFRKENLSSRELNDISMQMFRVTAISEMVNSAISVFVEKVDDIMSGEIAPGFEIIKNSSCRHLCATTKKFDFHFGFQHKDVLKLELQGSNHIKSMMDMLWDAVSKGESRDHPFERYVFGAISENYRRVYKDAVTTGGHENPNYPKAQLICDALSGMTESYLIKKHNEFRSLTGFSQ
ncbi:MULTISPECIES: deoxyguanosinetriphosphate triphosphohydrolase family protein [Stutzerimonas stutzeri group]|uniref:DNTP triphosphohydrolase n=2 Tax=Stutzerimonas stutzeri group TaxID=136846 RepID=A0ABX6XR09_9GAMM|nr:MULTISPECIES: dNTP triphosphohydrolase [Stutzerimonas stutzeri group]AEJ04827.1 putative deoxyguanosinetriphosphate triphosphohydrolase [Stutzerimonas stutzeri]MCQ4304482.1 dNTP triphosphohydrolase [Stutzerimonas frequens]PNF50142.1 HD domain-containing protein [Stutzerimonas frequens]QPT16277.1 dNTP triphosphohydrolase [Stutzerimonas frequens]QPT29853.1 dNTP triphosphohydrolase [Stutzerimonas stutzeri]